MKMLLRQWLVVIVGAAVVHGEVTNPPPGIFELNLPRDREVVFRQQGASVPG
jgi:hypothetical protein